MHTASNAVETRHGVRFAERGSETEIAERGEHASDRTPGTERPNARTPERSNVRTFAIKVHFLS